MNYFQFIQRLAELTDTLKADVNPTIIVPAAIDYAEQRLYRELDLLATRVADSSGNVTANQRTFNLPTTTGTFIVVETINVSTPSSVAFASGTRNPLMPVTKQFLDITYPTAVASVNGVPVFYAMQTNAQVILAPVPDANYPVEVTGTQRPLTLSASNPTTILTTLLPDIFTCAAVIGVADYMNASGKPIAGMTDKWEAQYQLLSKSAVVEEARKKYQSQGWTEAQPSPIATPPRT